jgi:hypothetical protein
MGAAGADRHRRPWVGSARADEIKRAFFALTKARAQGLIVLPTPVTLTHQTQIIELAVKNRLPVTYPWRGFTESGGLMAYSPNRTETALSLRCVEAFPS